MTITGGSGLPKDDIERMMRDAEAHAEEDRQRKEEAEIRNSAESLLHQTEKFLADNGDKVPEDAKSNVEGPLAELKTALAGDGHRRDQERRGEGRHDQPGARCGDVRAEQRCRRRLGRTHG